MGKYDMHQPFLQYSCGKKHLNFNEYYDCHCKKISRNALWSFYTGTVFCLITAALLFYSQLNYTYDDGTAGALFVSVIGCSLFIVPFGELVWSSKTRDGLEDEDWGGLGGGEDFPMNRRNTTATTAATSNEPIIDTSAGEPSVTSPTAA
jgi:hypothetical protein